MNEYTKDLIKGCYYNLKYNEVIPKKLKLSKDQEREIYKAVAKFLVWYVKEVIKI
jgi:hypothetical protein